MSTAPLPVDQARLKAVDTPHAGDWLHAPPLTVVLLRQSDEAIRVVIRYRLGTSICQSHTCVCVTNVESSTPEVCMNWHTARADRHIRHSQLHYLIWRAVKKVQILANKEAIGLSRADGKRPDGATPVPWTRGKPIA